MERAINGLDDSIEMSGLEKLLIGGILQRYGYPEILSAEATNPYLEKFV